MNIALCISGQPRTWKRCYRTWFDSISEYCLSPDVFLHLWDYNTLPNITLSNVDVPVQSEEIDELLLTLKPKAYQIESKHSVIRESTPWPKIKNKITPWALNQFYGVKKCAYIKRQYEIENDIEYDVVIRLRTDLFLQSKISIIDRLDCNAVYTTQNMYDKDFNGFRIADIFYYANSHCYDQMASFFDIFDYVEADWILPKDPCWPPEMALYYYIKMIGLRNIPFPSHTKIARTKEYADLRGGLDPYEII